MERIQKEIEVRCPVRTAYDQWTQFEEFPHFMDGVKEVTQIGDTHLHWRGEIWGRERSWDAEITEQVPDTLIAWHSTSGPSNAVERAATRRVAQNLLGAPCVGARRTKQFISVARAGSCSRCN